MHMRLIGVSMVLFNELGKKNLEVLMPFLSTAFILLNRDQNDRTDQCDSDEEDFEIVEWPPEFQTLPLGQPQYMPPVGKPSVMRGQKSREVFRSNSTVQ